MRLNRKERRALKAMKKDVIKLGNEDRLEIFNAHLKRQLLETQAQAQLNAIRKDEEQLFARIHKRHNVEDLRRDYEINVETGVCTLREGNEPPRPQEVPAIPPTEGLPEPKEEQAAA